MKNNFDIDSILSQVEYLSGVIAKARAEGKFDGDEKAQKMLERLDQAQANFDKINKEMGGPANFNINVDNDTKS